MSLLSRLHRIRLVLTHFRYPRFIPSRFRRPRTAWTSVTPDSLFLSARLVRRCCRTPFHRRKQIIALQQSVPRLEPEFLLDRPNIRIDLRPDFGRRCTLQMLVRPNVVVPKPELTQRNIQHLESRDLPLIEFLLQRPEQSFDPSVLPRATGIAALMSNPGQRQHNAKHPACKTRFIIRAHCTRLTVLSYRQKQMPEQSPRSFVRQGRQRQQPPAAMIDEAEDHVQLVLSVRLARQVQPPHPILRQ